MRARERGLGAAAAALVALLLLSYASIQSTVMQAAMAWPGAMALGAGAESMDAAMMGAGQGGMAEAGRPSKAGHAPARSCPYCAAAAHLPVLGTAPPVRAPTSFVFAAFRMAACRGPRGPPSFQSRARGPPTDPLTL